MATSFVFDNATGRAVEWHYQAYTVGSPQGVVVVVVDRTTASDSDMRVCTTLSALLATAVNEVTNVNYTRQVVTKTGVGQLALPAIATVSNVHTVDLPDQVYSNIHAGDAWTDIIICYAPNTAGADSTIIPMTSHVKNVTPDGGTITFSIADYLHAASA